MPYPAILDPAAIATVAAFLASAVRVQRAVLALTADRFIVDRLFAPGPAASTGAVAYDQVLAGGAFTSRDVEVIRPSAQFPRLDGETVQTLAAMVDKFGGEIPVSWEEVDDNRTDVLSRGMAQLGNTVLRRSDVAAVAALAAAPTNTLAVATPWATATAAQKVGNLVDAASLVNDGEGGYMATVAMLPTASVASLLKDESFRNALAGTTDPAILRTGEVGIILGMTVVGSPRLAAGTGYVAAARQVGGYAGDRAARSRVYTDDRSQSEIVQGWRRVVPYVTDPLAATRLTGL